MLFEQKVNHEDGLVISESLSDQAMSQFVETVYIPIFEHTLLQPIYQGDNEVSSYFPPLGKKIKGDVVISELKPRSSPISSGKELKNKMTTLLNSMNISELLNICSSNLTNFTVEHHKTKVKDGYLSGMKIHRLNKNAQLVDSNLQKNLEKIYKMYILDYISESFHKLKERVSHNYAEQITRTHFLNIGNNFSTTNRQDLKQAVYILELEISRESKIELGDKLCNRFASKGVTSLILPEELRPYTKQTGYYIDLINNPFGELMPRLESNF
ncbi:MAG: hypothetical protein K9H48_07780 [Melioribacteraceae bacterium]|nr:hypothetical protein [Melioribacteraceae bacterium]